MSMDVSLALVVVIESVLPLFTIICMLPMGKMVALPGVRISVTSLAPFSSYIYVVVLPCTATT